MEYLTVSQAAERLQLSIPTVKRYIYDGQLRSVKLPGGQHRIPHSEIERLLRLEGTAAPEPETTSARRLEVLERWVTELEAEVERLAAALSVLARYCEQAGGHTFCSSGADHSPARVRIQVLGPGCRRCNQLYERTVALVAEMGAHEVEVKHTRDLAAITAFGPVATPGLVINDRLVLSGRVPSPEELRKLLDEHLR